MTELKQNSPAKDWLKAELADTLDEDYELEMSEPALSMEIAKIYKNAHPPSIDRMQYFRDLISLQSELIKLQSWVAYHKKKVVVVFEGRDSAGRAASSSASPSGSTRAFAASSHFRRRPSARNRNGISSVMSRICRPAARSCCSTAPGITAPASSG
ncbi:hypothetical protein AJ88_06735 [Mesorhizobium amorphae CCBAU 01583]|nr:hypothetical protein AJ88_06735 [Mesorhizobium amorphae CCBAU 01583]